MKKTKKIEFRVTLTEALIIKNKAEKVGCSVSEYIRNTALEYSLAYKLTPEEIEVYKLLKFRTQNWGL